jgi:hypothetical protein
MEYAEIANQVIQILNPASDFGLKVSASLTGHAIWDLLKKRFTKDAFAEAIREAEEKPSNKTNWDELKIRIQKALVEDEDFRKEIQKFLPKSSDISMEANVSGSGSVVVQNVGNSHININK